MITFSKKAFAHYLLEILTQFIDKDEGPPATDSILIPSEEFARLSDILQNFSDDEPFRVALEFIMTSINHADIDELEFSSDPDLFWFSNEDLKKICNMFYLGLYPNSTPTSSRPIINWTNGLWSDWILGKNIPNYPPGIPPIRNKRLTKTQFRMLLAYSMPNEFRLPSDIRQKGYISPEERIEVEAYLMSQMAIGARGNARERFAKPIKQIVTAGWKLMLDIKGDNVEWSQCFLHLSEDAIVGEALTEEKDRLISDIQTVEDAVAWLTDVLPVNKDGRLGLPSQSLESLSDQLTAVVRMAILNTSDQQPAKAAGGWLVTAESMWFIDEQIMAENVAYTELSERIAAFIQSNVPENKLPQQTN